MVLAGCDNNELAVDDRSGALTSLEVHFQGGFGGEGVLLELDGRDVFRGTLGPEAPLSGPQAVIADDIEMGTHRLRVTVIGLTGEIAGELELDLEGPLYVGVGFSPETGVVHLYATEDPFLYL